MARNTTVTYFLVSLWGFGIFFRGLAFKREQKMLKKLCSFRARLEHVFALPYFLAKNQLNFEVESSTSIKLIPQNVLCVHSWKPRMHRQRMARWKNKITDESSLWNSAVYVDHKTPLWLAQKQSVCPHLTGTADYCFSKSPDIPTSCTSSWNQIHPNSLYFLLLGLFGLFSYALRSCCRWPWVSDRNILCQQVFRKHTYSSHSNSIDKTY